MRKTYLGEMMILEVIENMNMRYKYSYCLRQEDIWRMFIFAYRAKWQYFYCRTYNDRKEVWKALANNKYKASAQYQYYYCLNVKDRKEMWRALAKKTSIYNDLWQYMYCIYVKDRDAIRETLLSSNSYWKHQYEIEKRR